MLPILTPVNLLHMGYAGNCARFIKQQANAILPVFARLVKNISVRRFFRQVRANQQAAGSPVQLSVADPWEWH